MCDYQCRLRIVNAQGTPENPTLIVVCDCRPGAPRLARFELRLEDPPEMMSKGGGLHLHLLASTGRVTSLGGHERTAVAADGGVAIRCPSCNWTGRFTDERIRRALVTSTLRAMKQAGPGNRNRTPVQMPATVLSSDQWDADWSELGRAAGL